MKCIKCDSENLQIIESGPHNKLVCGDCLAFQKFLSKSDAKTFQPAVGRLIKESNDNDVKIYFDAWWKNIGHKIGYARAWRRYARAWRREIAYAAWCEGVNYSIASQPAVEAGAKKCAFCGSAQISISCQSCGADYFKDRTAEIYKTRWEFIKTDPGGARALLLLLEDKGSPIDFDTMVDRIIESRKISSDGICMDCGKWASECACTSPAA